MNKSITDRISSLEGMSKPHLLTLWAEHFHQPPPRLMRRKLMISVLAYRLLEKEYGGLSHAARTKLRHLAKGSRSERRSLAGSNPQLKTSTRFIRSWKGEVHEVNVEDEGYEYRGKRYGSLSAIAREITGTRWSGPLFFGSKRRAA